LEQFAGEAKFIPDAQQQGNDLGLAAGRSRFQLARAGLVTAHAGVKEVADGLVFLEALDHQLRPGRAGGGLDLDVGQAEPALEDARAQVNVLDAGVGQVGFPAEQDADLHVDALLVQAVAERMIAEVEVGQGGHQPRPGQDRAEDVVGPERRVRPLEGADWFGHRFDRHKQHTARVTGVLPPQGAETGLAGSSRDWTRDRVCRG